MAKNEPVLCPNCRSDDVFIRGEACICGNCGSRFQLPKEEKPFQPLNLFLSYGHTEDLICRLINQALKDRGHITWFDEDKLRQGQDWRQKIADGIKNSNGVISCLSRHSVRDPGVCLNELSIAIGVWGGNIRTILLEPEKEVRPPASLCHVQWLDMSDWRQWYDRGEDAFRPWFEAKMEQLFQVIESDESREFTGQISAIQEKLHINYDTSKQRDLLRRLFVGREWLTEQLERWLDDPAGARLCVLYGDPGVGKSAFADNYIHYNPRVAAGLFCEYDRPAYNDAATVLMTLSYLLACRLPAYRTALVSILEREQRLGMMNASELFDLLLAEPLTSLTIDGGHETLCVVIDGLDECGQGEYNALAEVLARYVPRLPAWLRVLVTSREVAAVRGPLAGAFALELHGDGLQNQKDVRSYFAERLKESRSGGPAWDRALDTLARRSGGIFLYAQLVCEGILAGKLSVHDADHFPDGLSDAFYQWFGWFFPDDREYKEDFRLPLGMLLAAPEPLPVEELRRVFEWDSNRLGDFLRRVEVLLRRDADSFGKETITFSHLYLNEWLDTERAGRFRSHRAAALERMAERFYALFRKDVRALTEYESLHMAALLERCGNTAALAEVTLSHELFWKIDSAGDYCATWGKLSAALACYEQARAMAEQMVRERGAPDDLMNLSAGCNDAARILGSRGDLDRALALFQKGLAITERLVRERGTPNDRRSLSCCYDNAAGILSIKGELDEALKLGRKSVDIAEQLARQQGAQEDRMVLGNAYFRYAGTLFFKGDLEGALALLQKSIAIMERLVRERGTMDDLRALSTRYKMAAGILKSDDPDRALELFQKSVAIGERLIQKQSTPDDRRELSLAYTAIAEILEAKNDRDRALELRWKSIELAEQLVRERGTSDDFISLVLSCFTAAGPLQGKDDLDGALELYRKSIEAAEQLVRERGAPYDRRLLSTAYYMAADIFQAMGDPDRALEVGRKSIELGEQLMREWDIPDYCMNLVSSYLLIANLLRDRDDPDGALELCWKGIELGERLVRERGASDDCRLLGLIYYLTADILQEKDDLDRALELYRKGIEVVERLVRERGLLGDRTILSDGYGWTADALQDKGDLDGALELYRKGMELCEQVARERGSVSDYTSLARVFLCLADLPVPPDTERLAYARQGLELSEQLLQETGEDEYRELCEDFRRIIEEIE